MISSYFRQLYFDILAIVIATSVMVLTVPDPVSSEEGCRFNYSSNWIDNSIIALMSIACLALILRPIASFLRALVSDRRLGLRDTLIELVRIYILSVFGFAVFYFYFGLMKPAQIESTVFLNYLDSLYFSVVTFTTLGYGDFQPCPSIRLVASIEALLGVFMLPLASAAIVSELNRPKKIEN